MTNLRIVTVEVDLLIEDDITPEHANRVLGSLLGREAPYLRADGIANVGGGRITQTGAGGR